MSSICLYMHVHQPRRLRNFSVFDIGKEENYFADDENKRYLDRIASKSYLPVNKILKDLIKETDGQFKVSLSISGSVLDQLEKFSPETLQSFKDLVATGNVDLLAETYYHSLSFLYSKEEFKKQVQLHKNKLKKFFGIRPRVFRNTELMFNNEIAKTAEEMGYKGVLAEGADHILEWRSPNFVYNAKTASKIGVLLRNYRLSDDIAFRFSNKDWKEWPLTTEKFAQWVNQVNGNGQIVNLFMDYETFGEHQWHETGILEFLKRFPHELLKHPDNDFVTTTEAVKKYKPTAELDVHSTISWADIERDLTAWTGNKMQEKALEYVYSLEKKILESKNKKLIEDWRRLQTSDHFYYMCTKWFSDGDVHAYFNPYESPYEAFITYMNIFNDLKFRLEEAK